MDKFNKHVLSHKDKKCILAYNLNAKETNAVEAIISDKFSLIKTNIFTDILALPSVGVLINPCGISESKLTDLFEYYFEGHSSDKSLVIVFMKPVKVPITLKENPIYVYKDDNIKQIYEQLCYVANMY